MPTEQEEFWRGEFGTEYIQRNGLDLQPGSTLALFSKILRLTSNVSTILELGASIGRNLHAIRQLLPGAELTGIDINADAVAELKLSGFNAECRNVTDYLPPAPFDFVFTKGVLIHIAPENLPAMYDTMYHSSKRYICVSEYYAPEHQPIPYRGHNDRLWRGDFAGDLMVRFPDLSLIDYGFNYRKDPVFPLDDSTWFLMEKT